MVRQRSWLFGVPEGAGTSVDGETVPAEAISVCEGWEAGGETMFAAFPAECPKEILG